MAASEPADGYHQLRWAGDEGEGQGARDSGFDAVREGEDEAEQHEVGRTRDRDGDIGEEEGRLIPSQAPLSCSENGFRKHTQLRTEDRRSDASRSAGAVLFGA